MFLSSNPLEINLNFLSAKSDLLNEVSFADEKSKNARLTQTKPSVKLNSKKKEIKNNKNKKTITKSDIFFVKFKALFLFIFLDKKDNISLPQSSG